MKTKFVVRVFITVILILVGFYIWHLFHAQEGTEVSQESSEAPGASDIDAIIREPEEDIQGTFWEQSDIDNGFLILVNKNNGLTREYKPDDLADIKYYAADRSTEGRYLRADAADAFHSMVEEAAQNNFTLVITTAYRSYDFQSTLYNNYVANDGQAAADRYSAKPGHSEHQTGLAADISSPSIDYKLTSGFADTNEGKWLYENARLFGFIIRYPAGKKI